MSYFWYKLFQKVIKIYLVTGLFVIFCWKMRQFLAFSVTELPLSDQSPTIVLCEKVEWWALSTEQSWDVIVIGAGAAGLFCAIEAAKRGRKTLVLDNGKRIGRKILMSGGGRCNFTNI